MALSRETLKAIDRYDERVDSLARQRYGISGAALLAKLVKGESGDRMDAVSSANARGIAQFIPGTRNAVKSRFGVDPWRSRDEAIHAAVLHLTGKLGNAKGLEGYNPGSSSYPKYILGQKVGDVAAQMTPSRDGGETTQTKTTVTGAGFDPGSGAGTAMLAQLAQQQARPQAPVSVPSPPQFAAQATMPGGYQAPSAPPVQQEGSNLTDLLSQVTGSGQSVPQVDVKTETTKTSGGGAEQPSSGGAAPRGRNGGFSGRARGGWRGAKGPADDLARIGFDLGLKATSTKRNNQNPYSGKNSDHEITKRNAYAYDLSNGSQPTPQMDRAAFRIARALGIKGYKMGQPINQSVTRGNVRVQVIYRGTGPAFGGNHMNHVHVGVERVR